MYHAILFLPLAGAVIAGFFGRALGDRASGALTSIFVLISMALSWVAFFQVGWGAEDYRAVLFSWMVSGDLEAHWTLRVDTLTAVMLVVVNTVSGLVHVYSNGYMHEDPGQPRFFSYLSLFTFAMLMLVTADNFLQLFFGWEGVGLASYLLIGFWYHKPSACNAAIKAFVVNRVGDFGFALGIFAIFALIGTVSFDATFAAAHGLVGKTIHFLGGDYDTLTVICLLLFMGAMGKSAQFLLHTWLPDAMEGPTPVSALIHAATMVTAGVFMVARLSPLFALSETALTVVTVVGATTAFFAATIGVTQNDIKRVIAYSTCSQLGYMFVALGVGAYGAGIFHLFTHAFFKALLFLGAGSVIHAMHHEQDMRHMGGIFPKVKLTWLMMLIGTLALTGFPFTAGFYSKDAIIEAAHESHNAAAGYAYAATVIAAFLTSFYSWRLMFMTFHGKPRMDHEHFQHVHESPAVMTVPLIGLAIGAVFAGAAFSGVFIGHEAGGFWRNAIVLTPHAAPAAGHGAAPAAHEASALIEWLPTIMMAGGFVLAFISYIAAPQVPAVAARVFRPIYLFSYNKWYFDELYDLIFIRPVMWLGRVLWKVGDGAIIDGLGPDGVSARVLDTARGAVKLQTGYVYTYAFVMLIGVAALVSYFLYVLMGGM
jgi:NADH-quinone oxidoreductase subunit L